MSLLMKKREQESQRSNGLNDPAGESSFHFIDRVRMIECFPFTATPQQTTMTNQILSSNFSPAVNNVNQSGYQDTPRPTLMNVAQHRPRRSCYREHSAPIASLLQQSFTNVSRQPKAKTADHVTPETFIDQSLMTKFPSMDFQTKISPEVMKSFNLPEGSYFGEFIFTDKVFSTKTVLPSVSLTLQKLRFTLTQQPANRLSLNRRISRVEMLRRMWNVIMVAQLSRTGIIPLKNQRGTRRSIPQCDTAISNVLTKSILTSFLFSR